MYNANCLRRQFSHNTDLTCICDISVPYLWHIALWFIRSCSLPRPPFSTLFSLTGFSFFDHRLKIFISFIFDHRLTIIVFIISSSLRLGMAMRHILPMHIDAHIRKYIYFRIFTHYPHHSEFAASAWPSLIETLFWQVIRHNFYSSSFINSWS